jgi:uncharacterized protein (DUF1778 family)
MAKTTSLNMRVEPEQRELLTRASALLHQDRTAFVIDAACQRAKEVLLDQCLFQLDEKKMQAFELALEAPVEEIPALRALLAEKAPWD